MNNIKPPRWIDSLIDNLAPLHLAEEIRGDLHELFVNDIAERGIRSARRRYALRGLGFLTKRFFWKKSPLPSQNPMIMLGNYFKMAKRSLLTYKGNTVINILGLVTGMASALVILTVLRFELGFDKFHSHADRIYRIVRVGYNDLAAVGREEGRAGVSYPVPGAIKEEVATLENITSMQYFGHVLVEVPDASGDITRRFQEGHGCAMIEPSFFKIFDFKGTDFKWIAGNPETALNAPFNVVLTRTLAEKYFPGTDALGMTLRFEKKFDCKITGIIEDMPANTDFPFTILVSYVSLQTIGGNMLNDWVSVDDDHQTYVLLSPGTTKEEMEMQIAKVHAVHTPKDLHESRFYLLQELSDLHYDPRFGNYNGRTITRETLLALSLVAVFLLLTGSINYINLSTAQSTMRSREIGLRKVLGSNRKSLIAQFMTETFIVVLVAGIIALALAQILLLNLKSVLNLQTGDHTLTDPFMFAVLAVIVILVTLLSGFYPSLIVSRFNPIVALRNKFTTEKVGGVSFRKALVVTQFSITQVLVVGTFIVVAQMEFFRNQDMGFNREAIVNVELPDRDAGKRTAMADQLRAQAFVSDLSFSYTLPSGVHRRRSAQDIERTETNTSVIFEYQSADPAFIELFQIKLLAGRNLAPQDSSGNVLINNSLARSLQFGSPEEAIGRELKMSGTNVTVVGVVSDFYSNSFKNGIDNIVMALNPKAYTIASIKLDLQKNQGSLPDVIKQIEKIWTTVYPEYIFDYRFFDENIKAFYAQEQKYAQLFQLFSLIFLLIGCLGLYGLITFVVNRKGKEVAIRKVLGATIANLLLMFSREYVQLIVLSFLLAVPVAYYVLNNWLNNFSTHIELEWWLFAIPGFLVLVITMLVVGSKMLRTARMNPIEKLKYE